MITIIINMYILTFQISLESALFYFHIKVFKFEKVIIKYR